VRANRHNTKVIPGPLVIVIEVAHSAADPGVTESDVIRWVGVVIAVVGAILATPEGIASIWLYLKQQQRKLRVLAKRLLRHPTRVVGQGGVMVARSTMSGTAHASPWQPWLPLADADSKIEILHKQVDFLQEEINQLRRQMDRTSGDLTKKIREAEDRVRGLVEQLSSELRGERRQASRVDARGLGPIALGIVLTGLRTSFQPSPLWDGWPLRYPSVGL
jgi:hypothetical protein